MTKKREVQQAEESNGCQTLAIAIVFFIMLVASVIIALVIANQIKIISLIHQII